MSKLHDEFLKVKRENSEDPTTLIFNPEYWDEIMENIEDMNFNKSEATYPGYTFITIPYETDYFAMAINKENPQICKFLGTRRISETQWEIAQEFEDCDEVRCPAKYDQAMEELNYIINNRK